MILTDKTKATWKFCRELGPLGPVMIFAIAAPALGAIALASTSKTWLPFIENLGNWAVPTFLALSIVLVGLCLIPTHASSLISGMVFGAFDGSVYAITAVVTASYLAFKLMSLITKDTAYEALLRRPKAKEMYTELLKKDGFKAVTFIALIRLSPVMPFAGTNLLLAASKVKTIYFLLGSFIGLAPRIIIVAVAGAGLAELDFSKTSNIWMAILGGISTVALIYIIGRVVRKTYHMDRAQQP